MTRHTERGMSLVEASVILLVLMLLTSVLAPSIYDFVVDARMVKVKEDCEAIGVSVVRLVLDVGTCLKYDGTGACTPANHVKVLFSRGTNAGWPTAGSDDMERHLTSNAVHYHLPQWRGAYLPSAIGPDPWGSAYAVNVGSLRPDTPAECFVNTVCLSGGPNRTFDTPLTSNINGGLVRGADDFVFVLGGGTCTAQPQTQPGCQ
jgi:hypothetical protein